jgi:hypothetical protein
MAVATTCWAADAIRPTSHTYAKMALHLLDAIAPQETPRPGGFMQHNRDRGGGGGLGATRQMPQLKRRNLPHVPEVKENCPLLL